MREMKDPVFLLSSERSGTNFLRRALGKRSDMDDPVPIHFLKWVYPAAPFYGDLRETRNFERLVADALDLATKHFSPWEQYPSRSEFFAIPEEERSVMAVFELLYGYHARAYGKKRFFCKDNHLFEFLYPITQHFPEARFIYLYRDPRDYALSQLRRTFMTDDLYEIACLWRDEQFKCFQALSEPSLRSRTYMVGYEELLTNEEEKLQEILDHIGEERVERDEEGTDKKEKVVQEWQNLEQGAMRSNFKKYKKALSSSDIALIESVCWNPMRYLGYETEFQERPRIPSWKLLFKRAFGRVKGKWKKSSRKGISKEEMERRKERGNLIRSFKERYY